MTYDHEMYTGAMQILQRVQRRSISTSIVQSNSRRVEIRSVRTNV